MRRRLLHVMIVALAGSSATLWGYTPLEPQRRWADGNIVMQEQLGGGSGDLIDGSRSWNEAFEPALSLWNNYLDRVTFAAVRDSAAPNSAGNGINNVYFSSNLFGRAWDNCCLAVTRSTFNTGGKTLETDLVYNSECTWNSYRGNLRQSPGAKCNGWLIDIRRVSLHELGHVLGLDHPDEHGQDVASVMNAVNRRENGREPDSLQADDIAGAQALYTVSTGSGVVVAFPPRNELLDFRTQLESKYRDGLRRPSGATYVDKEGAVIWTQEYFRYRVNRCDHSTATTRVLTEIDTGGVVGVCGGALGGVVTFPPRNEALDFRNRLEGKYRDDLRRTTTASSVDLEGEVVWTQEYLRYRVNSCTHGDAIQRVFLQLDGAGIQPVCR